MFNFAQGELVMVGAMLGVVLWIGSGLPFWVALIVVIISTAAIGALTELVAVRRLAGQSDGVLWILSTLGVAIVIKAIVTILVTSPDGQGAVRSFPAYFDTEPIQLGGLTVIVQRAVLIPIAIGLTFAVWFWFHRSRTGRGLLAMAADREGAAMRGLPIKVLAVVAFALGGALAGIGGITAGPITQASTEMGFALTLNAFIAATIGGIPKLWGPLLGGAILGIGQQLTATFLGAELQVPLSLALLLVVLAVKPSGLLTRSVRAL